MRTSFFVVFLLAAGCGSVAPSPPAQVAAQAQVPAQLAPPGTAAVRPLVQGREAFLGVLRLEPGAAVPEHRDETEEYLYVLSGGGEITIDGSRSTLAPGTAVYMPAGASVSFRNGPKPTEVVQVFAGPEPAAKYSAWKTVDGPG